MKVTVIGGASSYSPELVNGLLSHTHALPLERLTLMDPDARRLGIVAGFCRRMAKQLGHPVQIDTSVALEPALEDSDFVVTQIRVGGMAARISDEKLGRRYGILGQETTGVGGFTCALRTIPRIVAVAQAMEEICPGAFLLNFTNPSGIVTEAVAKHSNVRVAGLCNIPIGMEMDVAKHLGCAHEDVELDYVGLNHLSWVYGVRVAGHDRTEDALDALIAHAVDEWDQGPICDAMMSTMRGLGMYCNPYLQYFYAPEATLVRQARQITTRGEDVKAIEDELFAIYGDSAANQKPEMLSKRGGAHYSTAALAVMRAIWNDEGARLILCARNNGAVPGFDDDAVLELPARVSRESVEALPQQAPSHSIRGLMQTVKSYESLTVDAAVTGDRNTALQAMMANPLFPGVTESAALLDELLAINEPHLRGTFFPAAAGVGNGF